MLALITHEKFELLEQPCKAQVGRFGLGINTCLPLIEIVDFIVQQNSPALLLPILVMSGRSYQKAVYNTQIPAPLLFPVQLVFYCLASGRVIISQLDKVINGPAKPARPGTRTRPRERQAV